MKPSHTIRPVFDDLNLVPAAGLVDLPGNSPYLPMNMIFSCLLSVLT